VVVRLGYVLSILITLIRRAIKLIDSINPRARAGETLVGDAVRVNHFGTPGLGLCLESESESVLEFAIRVLVPL
jgi:hypothetical protein